MRRFATIPDDVWGREVMELLTVHSLTWLVAGNARSLPLGRRGQEYPQSGAGRATYWWRYAARRAMIRVG